MQNIRSLCTENMSSCAHAATETKRYRVTIEVLFFMQMYKVWYDDCTNILDDKVPFE